MATGASAHAAGFVFSGARSAIERDAFALYASAFAALGGISETELLVVQRFMAAFTRDGIAGVFGARQAIIAVYVNAKVGEALGGGA